MKRRASSWPQHSSMLRTALPSARALGIRPLAPAAGRQWHLAVVAGHRSYWTKHKNRLVPIREQAKLAVLLTSQTRNAATTPPLAPETPATAAAAAATAAAATGPTDKVLLTPPPPSSAFTAPKRRSFVRRLRNYVLMITVLGALGFGGGVWYSRINDEFHDLFTQYVPYGEQAVLYLEERDFRQRLPAATPRKTSTPRNDETRVNIPAQSGASWRVADEGSRHSSALLKADSAVKEAVTPQADPPPTNEARKETAKLPKTEAGETANQYHTTPHTTISGPALDKSDSQTTTQELASNATKYGSEKPPSGKQDYKPPEVNEPSSWPPASPIDPLSVNDASEPIVQELVHMLNDIIFVINADGAEDKYGRTISKAKDELNEIGRHIRELKEYAEQQAANQVRAKVDDFDHAATNLVARVEAAMVAQEAAWRREFEAEMGRLNAAYDEKVRTVAERERQVGEARADSQLLAQALALQRQFARDVKAQVEKERGARLGQLEALHKSVAELEELASDVNRVVDASLQTQRLHVAIEAVKASLADPAQPRPFIRELVALKETAGDDAAVVAAAIASIDPKAYQRGVASHAELVDRFRRVAGEVRKASLLPEDAGVASLASSWALSKLMFQKKGLAAGDDVESILTRTHTFLEQGDLDQAAREMNGLAGWAKVLSKDWLAEIRKVLEVKQALEVIEAEARLQSLRVD